MLANATIQPKPTVELGYMCPRGLWRDAIKKVGMYRKYPALLK